MPTPPKKYFQAWSYSRLKDWETCPLRASLVHLHKMRGPSSPAMERGAQVHEDIARWLTSKKRAPCPSAAETFSRELAKLKRSKQLAVEQKWGFDRGWRPIEFFDMANQWLRVVLDAFSVNGRVAEAIDHKTGRHNDEKVVEYKDQMRLYAPAAFAMEPKVQKVRALLWFTDAGKEEVEEYDRADLPELKKYWEDRSAPMMADRRLAPTPGDHCRAYGGCPFSKKKGGPCKY